MDVEYHPMLLASAVMEGPPRGWPDWRAPLSTVDGVGSGDVSLQAYHLIHNLHVNIAKIPIDRLACDLTVAGLSLVEWGLVGLTSSLLGLPVKTTRRVIQTTSEQEFLQRRSARADLQPLALTASARKHVQLAPVPRPPIPDTRVHLQVLDGVSRGPPKQGWHVGQQHSAKLLVATSSWV